MTTIPFLFLLLSFFLAQLIYGCALLASGRSSTRLWSMASCVAAHSEPPARSSVAGGVVVVRCGLRGHVTTALAADHTVIAGEWGGGADAVVSTDQVVMRPRVLLLRLPCPLEP
jgi:hypothetical protein